MTDRRLTLLLVASLLGNLFAAGVIGGGLLMLSHRDARPAAGMPHRPVADAGAALPDPDHARFAHLMRRLLRDNRDLTRTARESRETAADLFVQPQFDADAVNAALQRARDADLALRARVETGAVGFAATLPIDERALLAAGLARGGPLRHPAGHLPAPK